MERSRLIRLLRIAMTAMSLTASLLFVALWVRSHSALDSLQARVFGDRLVHFQSVRGHLVVFMLPEDPWRFSPSAFSNVSFAHVGGLGGTNPLTTAIAGDESYTRSIFRNKRICLLPWYVPVLLAAAVAFGPWISWCKRFSLRILLIATTLLAVALGAVVAMS